SLEEIQNQSILSNHQNVRTIRIIYCHRLLLGIADEMTPQSLLASAAINFGLALVVLSLFSILKKQPSNASVYYPRPLSDHRRPDVSFDAFSFRRLLPSISWISRAFHVTEDDIILFYGLDTLVVFRLFKFGYHLPQILCLFTISDNCEIEFTWQLNSSMIVVHLIKFFVVTSLVGLVILIPLNYSCNDGPIAPSNSMNAFTISNVPSGSNWLWVHFSCLWIVSFYGLYLLHKENRVILDRRIQQLCSLRNRPDQFTILVHEIPLCTEHARRGCNVEHFFSKHYPYTYQSFQMLYDEKDLDALLNEASVLATKIENLKKKSLTKESHARPSLLEALLGNSSNISDLEIKFQDLSNEIHNMQSDAMLQQKELPVAFVTFKSRLDATLAAQAQHHPHAFVWITEEAPEPRNVLWKNLSIRSRKLLLYKISFFVGASLLTLFFALPVAAVQGIAKFEKLMKWFPPAMAIQLIPGLRSILTGYLPSVILNGFIYIVPFSFLGMAHLAGYITQSEMEIKVCHMVFYFLVGNVFLLSLLSGSLLDQLGESISHPRNIPSHLARAVAAQADFFTTYILTDGLSGFSLEILQAGLLIWNAIRSYTYGRGKELSPLLFSLPYFRVIPYASLSILIGIVYAIIAPLLLPFLVGYLYLGYAVYMNQIEDVYCTSYETNGQYWPYVHHYILFAIVFMQITMMGLFGLKSKPEASIATIPLLIFTLMFNEYCKLRFLPSFQHDTIQVRQTSQSRMVSVLWLLISFVNYQKAKEKDDLDEREGKLKQNSEKAANAYRPPYLRSIGLIESESSSSQQHQRSNL
ncbi:hypothetical protein V2J09_024153, partial [Rumex salicifolius]